MPPLKRPKDAMNNALKVLSRVTNVRVTDRSAAGLRHAIVNLLKVYEELRVKSMHEWVFRAVTCVLREVSCIIDDPSQCRRAKYSARLVGALQVLASPMGVANLRLCAAAVARFKLREQARANQPPPTKLEQLTQDWRRLQRKQDGLRERLVELHPVVKKAADAVAAAKAATEVTPPAAAVSMAIDLNSSDDDTDDEADAPAPAPAPAPGAGATAVA
jgi:hypothetical protein